MPKAQRKVNSDFTIINNAYLRDKELSNSAKGTLTIMLSKSEIWNFSVRGLATESTDGKQSVQTDLNLLEKHGYLMRERIIDEKGRFVDTLYTYSDEPMPEAIEAYQMKMEKKKQKDEKKKAVEVIVENDCRVESTDSVLPYPAFRDTDNRDTEKPYPEKSDNNKILKEQVSKERISSDKKSIYQSMEKPANNFKKTETDGQIDRYVEEQREYTEIVKDNINYSDYADWIRNSSGYMTVDELDEIVGMVVRAICSSKKTDNICGNEMPREVIKSVMLKVDRTCIENAVENIKKTDNIRNYEKYLISTLFNEVNGKSFKTNTESRWAEYAVHRDLGY